MVRGSRVDPRSLTYFAWPPYYKGSRAAVRAQPCNLRRIVLGLDSRITSLAVLLHELDDAVIGVGKDPHLHRPTFGLQLLQLAQRPRCRRTRIFSTQQP